MFWGWMIDSGKKNLTSQPYTSSAGEGMKWPGEPCFSAQEAPVDSDQDAQGRDCALLIRRGFASEEALALYKLHEWYQHGGSDRAVVLYHLEFLRRLVASGHLER